MDRLKGSVIEYIDPTEPVSMSDGEAINQLNRILTVKMFRGLSDARLIGLALELGHYESMARMVMEERGLNRGQ